MFYIQKINNPNFQIIAVSVGEEKDTVTKFIKVQKYTFPIYLDTANSGTADYSTGSIPTTYLIDKNGIILGRIVGSTKWDTPEVYSLINGLLK